ncbi:MAG: Ig-like domain-containing protein, partial [Gemmatimonadaceae bacterium]
MAASLAFSILVGCGGGDNGTGPPVNTQRLGSIDLSPVSVPLSAGNTATLTAVALDQQGAVIVGAAGFSYTSSAPAVAEVSVSGSVFAVSVGSATITASLTRDGVTRTATSNVTVTGVLSDRAAITATVDNVFIPGAVAISRGGQVTFTFDAMHNVNFLGSGAPANILTMSG